MSSPGNASVIPEPPGGIQPGTPPPPAQKGDSGAQGTEALSAVEPVSLDQVPPLPGATAGGRAPRVGDLELGIHGRSLVVNAKRFLAN